MQVLKKALKYDENEPLNVCKGAKNPSFRSLSAKEGQKSASLTVGQTLRRRYDRLHV